MNIFLTLYRDIHQEGKTAHVKLTYPTLDVFGNRVYIANNIFEVEMSNR